MEKPIHKKDFIKRHKSIMYYFENDVTLDELAKEMEDLKSEYGGTAKICFTREAFYDYGYTEGITDISIDVSGPETDEEFKDRCKKYEFYLEKKELENRIRDRQEKMKGKREREKEIAEYKRLRKKYKDSDI